VDEKDLIIAGIDEAGRGCLAGPVVAACVILPKNYNLPNLTDSKKLSPKKRAILEKQIKEIAISWGIGLSNPKEIDEVNILNATLLAMKRAYSKLSVKPTVVYVDGTFPPDIESKVICVKKGDLKIPQVSAASILAKTFRDRVMRKVDRLYPYYGFAKHKGYATKLHLEKIREFGPCKIHRRTFKGVKNFVWEELCLKLK